MVRSYAGRRVGGLLIIGCVIGLAAPSAAPAGFDARLAGVDPFGTYYNYRARGTTCGVATTSGAGANTIYARTNWEMWAAKGQHVFQMRFRARLVPTTAGLNFTRSWSPWATAIIPARYQGNRYYLRSWVTTPHVSAFSEWKLQVQLKWDRTNDRDWNRKFNNITFNQGGACAPAAEA